ncbi:MAG: class I SAM-dependent methyltransferase [Pseudomonadota bacterium]|nr:class I SAM-dependent methyltransferase [Pseudomonadota bacterium]
MREADIRPADLLTTYLDLSRRDAETFFPDPSTLERAACPGCGADSERFVPQYTKHGFNIVECRNCRTLFVSPRPTAAQLEAFYRDSPSTDYWAKTFFPAVAEARRVKIFAPRAARALELARAARIAPHTVFDVGSGYGLFLQELSKLLVDGDLRAIEPGRALAKHCRASGIRTFEGYGEEALEDPDWRGNADLVASFEVIEHLPEPLRFLEMLRELARPGGLILISGLCGDGLDIRTLGPRSNAVSPPHHLTFLSQTGAHALLARTGLECISFETPGQLDVDILRTALKADDSIINDPELRRILLDDNDAVRDALQKSLVAECRSSHMWILARRPKESSA